METNYLGKGEQLSFHILGIEENKGGRIGLTPQHTGQIHEVLLPCFSVLSH